MAAGFKDLVRSIRMGAVRGLEKIESEVDCRRIP